MQSNQFPIERLPEEYIPGRYRRVKAWTVKTNIGEFTIYAINAAAVRADFKRLKPTVFILSIQRNS